MNTQSCSAAPPEVFTSHSPTQLFYIYLLPSHSLGRPLRWWPNSYFIDQIEAVRQEHPCLPTTPPSSSQFVYFLLVFMWLWMQCPCFYPFHSWAGSLGLLFSQLSHLCYNPPISFSALISFPTKSYLFHYLHCLQAFPLPHVVLLPCSLSQ